MDRSTVEDFKTWFNFARGTVMLEAPAHLNKFDNPRLFMDLIQILEKNLQVLRQKDIPAIESHRLNVSSCQESKDFIVAVDSKTGEVLLSCPDLQTIFQDVDKFGEFVDRLSGYSSLIQPHLEVTSSEISSNYADLVIAEMDRQFFNKGI